MKKTGIKAMFVIVLALTVLAGETLAQPGRGGRGVRPGWGRDMVDGPQRGQNFQPVQPDNSWVPGPYCPWAQGPNQNIQPRQGRRRGGFGQYFQRPRGPFCPFGQSPNQNNQGRQNRGPGRFNRDFQGRGSGGFNQDFQGRGQGPYGQGVGRQDMMMQRGPIAGRGCRGFQHRNIAPQGRGMNNWWEQPGPIGRGGQDPGLQPRRFIPEDWEHTYQPMPPGSKSWAPGSGQGWRQGQAPGPRQGWTPGWGQDWTPDWNLKPQPEKAPNANVPEPPTVEEQPEKPQGE